MNLKAATFSRREEEASVGGVKMLAPPPPSEAVGSGRAEVILVHLCSPRTQPALGVHPVSVG